MEGKGEFKAESHFADIDGERLRGTNLLGDMDHRGISQTLEDRRGRCVERHRGRRIIQIRYALTAPFMLMKYMAFISTALNLRGHEGR